MCQQQARSPRAGGSQGKTPRRCQRNLIELSDDQGCRPGLETFLDRPNDIARLGRLDHDEITRIKPEIAQAWPIRTAKLGCMSRACTPQYGCVWLELCRCQQPPDPKRQREATRGGRCGHPSHIS